MCELQCWIDEWDYIAERHGLDSNECVEAMVRGGGTCMLRDGHDGDHVFTNDDEVMVSVNPANAGKGEG